MTFQPFMVATGSHDAVSVSTQNIVFVICFEREEKEDKRNGAGDVSTMI